MRIAFEISLVEDGVQYVQRGEAQTIRIYYSLARHALR